LCVQRKILTHNPQPATLFAATHLGWSKPFTICHSLLAIRCCFTNRYSPVAIRHSLFAIRYSLLFRLGSSLALPIPFCSRPASHTSCPVLSRRFNFCVINYGLKSVAWFVFALPSAIHAAGFSQWLMTKFLSVEFIRHLRGRTSR
jgi:hypothetical protein